MTGFRRSRKSLDNGTDGMLICRIVVDTPLRSKTDRAATQPRIFHHVLHSTLAPSFATLLQRASLPAMLIVPTTPVTITREPISKKLRFEVFKRDSFRCQYRGAAP